MVVFSMSICDDTKVPGFSTESSETDAAGSREQSHSDSGPKTHPVWKPRTNKWPLFIQDSFTSQTNTMWQNYMTCIILASLPYTDLWLYIYFAFIAEHKSS